jgi:ribosomal-protein-alanine N-acetyltransferase
MSVSSLGCFRKKKLPSSHEIQTCESLHAVSMSFNTESIDSDNIKLRRYRRSDAPDLTRNINNEKIASAAWNIPYPYSISDAEKYLSTVIDGYESTIPDRIDLAITISDCIIGSVNVKKDTNTGVIGYWLAESYWGKGIMTRAAAVAIEKAFEDLKVCKIIGRVFSDNKASQRVLLKLGFEYTGKALNENGREIYLFELKRHDE